MENMENDTVKLLEECSKGCKMAINSIRQLQDKIMEAKLKVLLDETIARHRELENRAIALLAQYGRPEKKPGALTEAFSWTMAQMKMGIHDEDSTAVKLIMDGCNMGIQTISNTINQSPKASPESVELARKLVKTEEELFEAVKKYR